MVNFPEGPETVQVDMREIAPVGLLFPSRVWENLASSVRFRINDSTWVNRKLYEMFLPIHQLIYIVWMKFKWCRGDEKVGEREHIIERKGKSDESC
jgi:long-subunit acyl-CoA synthetase (AMP-forming)